MGNKELEDTLVKEVVNSLQKDRGMRKSWMNTLPNGTKSSQYPCNFKDWALTEYLPMRIANLKKEILKEMAGFFDELGIPLEESNNDNMILAAYHLGQRSYIDGYKAGVNHGQEQVHKKLVERIIGEIP